MARIVEGTRWRHLLKGVYTYHSVRQDDCRPSPGVLPTLEGKDPFSSDVLDEMDRLMAPTYNMHFGPKSDFRIANQSRVR